MNNARTTPPSNNSSLVSALWLVVKLAGFIYLSLNSLQIINIAYQQF